MLRDLLDKARKVKVSNPALAEELLLRCLLIEPRSAEALRELAVLLCLHKKEHSRALELITSSMRIEESTEADLYYLIILNSIENDLQDEFEANFKRSIGKVEGVFKGFLEDEYARFLACHGRFSEALWYQRSAATRCPDYPYIQARLLHLEKYLIEKGIATSDKDPRL